jgi:hypothetical protein
LAATAGAGAGAGAAGAGSGPSTGVVPLPPPPQAASKALLPPTVSSDAPSLSICRRAGAFDATVDAVLESAAGEICEEVRGVLVPRGSSETDMKNERNVAKRAA